MEVLWLFAAVKPNGQTSGRFGRHPFTLATDVKIRRSARPCVSFSYNVLTSNTRYAENAVLSPIGRCRCDSAHGSQTNAWIKALGPSTPISSAWKLIAAQEDNFRHRIVLAGFPVREYKVTPLAEDCMPSVDCTCDRRENVEFRFRRHAIHCRPANAEDSAPATNTNWRATSKVSVPPLQTFPP